MKLAFTTEALADLIWFRRYYRQVFPQGRDNGYRKFDSAKRVVRDNPLAGEPVEGTQSRRFVIPRTPFAIIYRVSADTITITRVLHSRAEPPQTE